MAKTKTPFFGLGSHGTVGNVLTTQQHAHTTIGRTKPIPAYRRTLPQLYQRWLYADYAYLWTQQSLATHQLYQSLGVRHHLTGFQYWMKHNLSHLPDIAGMWHLDYITGALTPDFSRNANHGIVYGASPTVGVIDGASLFDGLNDWIDCGNDTSLNFVTEFSLDFFFETLDPTVVQTFIDRHTLRPWLCLLASQKLRFTYRYVDGSSSGNYYSNTILQPNTKYHAVFRFKNSENKIYFSLNGNPDGSGIGVQPMDATTWAAFLIGRYRAATLPFNGLIDHLTYYNRFIDDAEIKRHSERGYP